MIYWLKPYDVGYLDLEPLGIEYQLRYLDMLPKIYIYYSLNDYLIHTLITLHKNKED